jgi:hypothetical protein
LKNAVFWDVAPCGFRVSPKFRRKESLPSLEYKKLREKKSVSLLLADIPEEGILIVTALIASNPAKNVLFNQQIP